ncbi:MAG: nucleotidyltransferase family protein [Xanthobacteraceae bacterium]
MRRATLAPSYRVFERNCRENGATGLFIFGSRAVGTQRPDSDLDLFIDYDPEVKFPTCSASCKSKRRLRKLWASRSPLRRGMPFTP